MRKIKINTRTVIILLFIIAMLYNLIKENAILKVIFTIIFLTFLILAVLYERKELKQYTNKNRQRQIKIKKLGTFGIFALVLTSITVIYISKKVLNSFMEISLFLLFDIIVLLIIWFILKFYYKQLNSNIKNYHLNL